MLIKTTTTLTAVLFLFSSYAQNIFETKSNIGYTVNTRSLFELNNAFYIASNTTKKNNEKIYACIDKLNSNGTHAGSLIFQDSTISYILRLIPMGNELLSIGIEYNKETRENIGIITRKIDTNLNIIQRNYIPLHIAQSSVYNSSYCLNSKGNLAFELFYFNGSYPDTLPGQLFLELNAQGMPLQIKENPKMIRRASRNTITCDLKNNGYTVFGAMELYRLDSLFNYLDTLLYKYELNLPKYATVGDVLLDQDSSYVLSLPYNAETNQFHIGISKLDTAFGLTKDIYFDYNEPLEIYPYYQSLDKTEDGYYLAVNTNFVLSQFETNDNIIRIIKLREDFSTVWEKKIETKANQFITCIKTTSDGGLILAGAYYDYKLPEQYQQLYILKVDSAGNAPVSVKEESLVLFEDHVVYPNPGNEYFNIDANNIPTGSTIELYNLTGQKLLSKQIEEPQQKINTSNLPSGMYLWNVVNNGNQIQQGKWVKQ